MPNHVMLDADGIIRIYLEGDQDKDSVNNLIHKTDELIAQAQINHKRHKLNFLVNVTKVGDQAISARKAGYKALTSMPYKKIAIVGTNRFVNYAMTLLIMASGQENRVQQFITEDNAFKLVKFSMNESQDLIDYKKQLRHNLKELAPIFAKATIGEFSADVVIPDKEDDLTVFLVGVQIILDAIREKISESDTHLHRLNATKKQLEYDKAVYQAIIDSMAEGLIVVDENTKITIVNNAAATQLSLNPKTALGTNYYELVSTIDRDGNPMPVEKRPLYLAIKTRHKQITGIAEGLQYDLKNGRSLPVSITASPVKMGEEVIGGVSTFKDISEEIALDRTKTEIISIASHQLRTPLTAIKWLTEQLSISSPPLSKWRQLHKIKQIHESNERMISLVNDLLNVSRIDLGKLQVMKEQFDLTKVINEVAHDLSYQAKVKHLRIVKHIDKKLRSVNSDPRFLQVILQNLMSNAIKYSFDNKSVVIASAVKNQELHIVVEDHGCGIPASQQSKVFEKLFRADNAKQMESKGTGLGLYVTKAMIEQLGGKIRYETKENAGSTFFVTIPLNENRKR